MQRFQVRAAGDKLTRVVLPPEQLVLPLYFLISYAFGLDPPRPLHGAPLQHQVQVLAPGCPYGSVVFLLVLLHGDLDLVADRLDLLFGVLLLGRVGGVDRHRHFGRAGLDRAVFGGWVDSGQGQLLGEVVLDDRVPFE